MILPANEKGSLRTMPIKEPQDHLSKVEKPDDHFAFTAGGETFTMPNRTVDVITVAFVRKNRRRDETDYTFTALEALAGEGPESRKILEAIDAMSRAEFKNLNAAFNDHLGAALGE